MELNDNKAGMEGLEKEKINAVIKEASKNSLFSKHQEKRDKRIKERIEQQRNVIETFNADKLQLAELQMNRLIEELENGRDLSRTIVHVDMDAFYAAVEMRDDPTLRDKPMAVGSFSMLSTSNYAARKFGVRAAQPGFIGKKLCPDLIIVPCNFAKYTKCSEHIRNVMRHYDAHFVLMSLDEAYLDLTEYLEERKKKSTLEECNEFRRVRYSGECICRLPYVADLDEKDAEECSEEVCKKCSKTRKVHVDRVRFGNDTRSVVEEIRFKIEQATGLTASAGIAVNAMLAKVCSDKNKPNGQFYLPADRETIMDFVKNLPIRKVGGIGGVTEAMLKSLGVNVCGDFFEKRALISLLHSKISAHFFMRIALGLGSSMFEHRDSDRKSLSVERTFSEISDPDEMRRLCKTLCENLAESVAEEELKGRTISLKLKTVAFEVRTRARSLDHCVCEFQDLFDCALKILNDEISGEAPRPLRLRLLGVRLSNLSHKNDKQPGKIANTKEITEYFKPVQSSSTENNNNESFTLHNEDSVDCVIVSDEDDWSRDGSSEVGSTCVVEISNCSQHTATTSSSDIDKTTKIRQVPSIKNYICPVCNVKLVRISNLTELNEHVDSCLSRKAIAEIANNEKGKTPKEERKKMIKRKTDETTCVVGGNAKKKTLNDYFIKSTL